MDQLQSADFGIAETEALTIEQAFLPKVAEQEILASRYKEIINTELSPELSFEARELRLKLVKVRTGIAETHKTQKAYFLRAGQFVDAWKNKLTAPVEQMEEKLGDIELHFVTLEKNRISELQIARVILLSEYCDTFGMDLGNMQQDVFDAYYEAQKSKRAKEIEQKKKDEEEAKLKAEEQEKARKEAEKKAILEAKEKAKAAAIEKEKLEKAKAKAEAELEESRKEADRLDRENNILKAKQKIIDEEASAKRLKEIEVIDAEILKPIEEKLTDWVNSFSLPEAPENNVTTKDIINKFNSFKLWAQKQI